MFEARPFKLVKAKMPRSGRKLLENIPCTPPLCVVKNNLYLLQLQNLYHDNRNDPNTLNEKKNNLNQKLIIVAIRVFTIKYRKP